MLPERLRSLRFRLSLWLSLSTTVVILLLFALALVYARELNLKRGGGELRAQQAVLAAGLGSLFADVEVKGREFAAALQEVQPNRQQLIAMMSARLLFDPDIGGLLVALEPNNPVSGSERLGLYVAYSAQGLKVIDFVADGYEFWTLDWYQRGLREPQPWWSEPYFNESSGGQDTTTLDMPLKRASGEPLGVVALDLTLDRIEARAAELGLQQRAGGRQFSLVSAGGRILLHSDPALERVHGVDEAAVRAGSASLARVADLRDDLPDGAELAEVEQQGQRHLAVAAPIAHSGWRLGGSIAEADLLAPLHDLIGKLALAAAGLLVGLLLLLAGVARRITLPLQQLSVAAGRIADGDFDCPLPRLRDRDELTRLVDAFERARGALRDSLQRLQAALGEQRRLTAELDVAQRIQQSMLPDDRTFFGGAREVEFAGLLRPARGVGGDFYGFLSPAPGVCFFYLGDVSGQGVPSALFMARLSTLLPVLIRQGGSPAELLRRVAEQIYQNGVNQGSDRELIASLLIGRLEIASGELQLASAGHAAPLQVGPDGSQQQLPLQLGPLLGADVEPIYPQWQGGLAAGDCLLGFTDGISEACDADGQRYTLERLQVACARRFDGAPRERVAALLDDVIGFIGAAEQADDIALLLLALRHRD